MAGTIRVGVGGWTFPPWRGVFYPVGTRQADELAFAGRALTAIEINSTYYSAQKPASFARWAAEVPEDFVFTVKASRFCTNRKVLAGAGESIGRFAGQGLAELGPRLGPILWQFMATKRFDPEDFAAFLGLLPDNLAGRRVRHCVEVRHASFADPRFVALCRDHGVAICASDNAAWPLIAEVTADFVYARLMRGDDAVETGYPPEEIAAWGRRLGVWAEGGAPDDLPRLGAAPGHAARDVFAFVIGGGKIRAPAAAKALIGSLA
ncbi:MAG: DUF72 domain-containing protein [Caulobacteraceae bacterium]